MAQTQCIARNNTTVYHDKDRLEVWLYNTCVVQVQHGTIRLCTGGWLTVTTLARMNQASNQYNLGYRASRKGGILTATYRGKTYTQDQDGVLSIPQVLA